MNANVACKDIVWKIGPFVDGELPTDERAAVEEHMVNCNDCVQMAINFRQLDALAAKDSVPPVTGEEWSRLWQGVMARPHEPIKSEAISWPRPSSFKYWIVPSLSAAAAALIGFTIGSLYFSGPGQLNPSNRHKPMTESGGNGTAALPTGSEPPVEIEDEVFSIKPSKPPK